MSKNRVYSYRKEFAPIFYEMTQTYMGGNNENDRVASPEYVPIQLKWTFPNKFLHFFLSLKDISLCKKSDSLIKYPFKCDTILSPKVK